MVTLGNRDPATFGLGATRAHENLLPCRGFIALLPVGVLGRVWHLGPSWARLLDIDLEESYQPLARWLEDSHLSLRRQSIWPAIKNKRNHQRVAMQEVL